MVWKIIQLVKGYLDVPDCDDPRYEEYLLEMADALRYAAKEAAEQLEDEVRFLRLLRGDCPSCGEPLRAITETYGEPFSYGMGYATERRVELLGYECPACGVRFLPEETGGRNL